MSTTPSRDHVSPRSAAVPPNLGQNKVRGSVAPPKPERHSCAYTFSNGHRCRMPRRTGHPYLCTFHARKEAQNLAADSVGQDIASYLSGAYISACDLNSALGRLFVAVAQGHINRKTAATLAYLAQSLVQTLHLAQHEYINAFGSDSWRRTVRSSFPPPDPPPVAPQSAPPSTQRPAPPPQPTPTSQSASPTPPAASSATTPQAPCSNRSSDRPAPAPPPPSDSHLAANSAPSTSHAPNSAGGASQVSPARQGWVTDPASSSAVGAIQTSSHPPNPAHR